MLYCNLETFVGKIILFLFLSRYQIIVAKSSSGSPESSSFWVLWSIGCDCSPSQPSNLLMKSWEMFSCSLVPLCCLVKKQGCQYSLYYHPAIYLCSLAIMATSLLIILLQRGQEVFQVLIVQTHLEAFLLLYSVLSKTRRW